MKKFLILLLSCFIFQSTFATDNELTDLFTIPTSQVETPFSSLCKQQTDKIVCSISIDKGAYLYKDSLKIASNSALIEILQLPKGEIHHDLNGKSTILKDPFTLEIKLINAKEGDKYSLEYRGCDAKGICYPTVLDTYVITEDYKSDAITNLQNAPLQNNIFGNTDNFILVLLLCFVFGMALDLTPCVFPMLSIYSATILGGKFVSIAHSFKQNFIYLLGLSTTYCLLGLLFSQIGVIAHSYLQHPVASILMSSLLLVFALDCMGVIRLRVPNLFNNKLQATINSQKTGTLSKAFIFGALSALITTPCTSAPLAGALIYVMNTGSLVKGMLMFFAIGLGMGLPLVFIGIYGSKLLSVFKGKSNLIRNLLAIPLVIGALYISEHLIGQYAFYVKAICYALCIAYLIGVLLRNKKTWIILCTSLLVGIAVSSLYIHYNKEINIPFVYLSKAEAIDNFKGSPTLITVSASWCSNCHKLDEDIYSSEKFKAKAKGIDKLRFDFTDPATTENQKLAKKLKIIGVPYLALIDKDGKIVKTHVGTFEKEELFTWLEDLKKK